MDGAFCGWSLKEHISPSPITPQSGTCLQIYEILPSCLFAMYLTARVATGVLCNHKQKAGRSLQFWVGEQMILLFRGAHARNKFKYSSTSPQGFLFFRKPFIPSWIVGLVSFISSFLIFKRVSHVLMYCTAPARGKYQRGLLALGEGLESPSCPNSGMQTL